MISELDTVVLTKDFPKHGLKAGDVGAVVMVYRDSEGYEVEFTTLKGQTMSVVTVKPDAIRSVEDTDRLHARTAAVA